MELWLLLHIGTAFWFVAGLVGRDVTLARARAASDMSTIQALCQTAGVFDRYMVTPGSMAVIVFGLVVAFAGHYSFSANGWMLASLLLYVSVGALVPLVYLPKGKVFERALKEAVEVGTPTPAFRAAFSDRTVWATRWYERAVVAVIIVLMITKPF
jgi:uncharacterized membrane protein